MEYMLLVVNLFLRFCKSVASVRSSNEVISSRTSSDSSFIFRIERVCSPVRERVPPFSYVNDADSPMVYQWNQWGRGGVGWGQTAKVPTLVQESACAWADLVCDRTWMAHNDSRRTSLEGLRRSSRDEALLLVRHPHPLPDRKELASTVAPPAAALALALAIARHGGLSTHARELSLGVRSSVCLWSPNGTQVCLSPRGRRQDAGSTLVHRQLEDVSADMSRTESCALGEGSQLAVGHVQGPRSPPRPRPTPTTVPQQHLGLGLGSRRRSCLKSIQYMMIMIARHYSSQEDDHGPRKPATASAANHSCFFYGARVAWLQNYC